MQNTTIDKNQVWAVLQAKGSPVKMSQGDLESAIDLLGTALTSDEFTRRDCDDIDEKLSALMSVYCNRLGGKKKKKKA